MAPRAAWQLSCGPIRSSSEMYMRADRACATGLSFVWVLYDNASHDLRRFELWRVKGHVAERYTRTVQNRIPKGLRVRVSPCPLLLTFRA